MSVRWYYTRDGKPAGPVSAAEFAALVKAGVVAPHTQVWCAGMTAWAPYAALRAPVEPAERGQCQCFECKRWWPVEAVIPFESHFICGECKPKFFQKLREGVTLFEEGLWQDGQFLIVARGAMMPDRCVRCNRPAGGFRLPAKVGTLLAYLPGRGLVLQRVPITIPLCAWHRQLRRALRIISGLLFFLGVVTAFLPTGMTLGPRIFLTILCWAVSPILLQASRYVGLAGGDLDHPKFSGAGRPFLASLPEWQPRSRS